MLGTTNLEVFIAAGLLLNITPGADILFIASRSASQGIRAGIVAALGIGAGCFIHILFAAFGLSVLLATSALAFTAVKLAGGAYLVYLGIATLLSLGKNKTPAVENTPTLSPQPYVKIFRQAILVNALNPKVALFFMAFLPQFVAPDGASPTISFLFLGCLFDLNGTLVNIVFAVGAAKIAGKFRQSGKLARMLKSAVGGLFIWLGVRLALTAQR
ncbi:MAG: lysine transporter LysE [Desulfobacterales bacterium GWB2_56_26]|nr:MAG: lysine transporter LysE [Desulfobacterales bacterium GWB2_56_26]